MLKFLQKCGTGTLWLALALCGERAHATRYAPFAASGTNTTSVGNNYSQMFSSCSVTVVNDSDTIQKITYNITLKVNGVSIYASGDTVAYLSARPGAAGTGYIPGSTDCQSSTTPTSNTCTFPQGNRAGAPATTDSCGKYTYLDPSTGGGVLNQDFVPRISCRTASTQQQVECSGYIKVDDYVAGVTGYVTASGQITTYMEAAPGVAIAATSTGSSRASTVTPTTIPIIVGEGRPF